MSVMGDNAVLLARMNKRHIAQTRRWLAESPRLRAQVDCSERPTPRKNAAYWLANFSDSTREDYAVLSLGGRHVGNCGLKSIDAVRLKAELWLYLGTSKRRGIGSMALEKLLKHAFEALGLNRVYIRVLESNAPAIRFYVNHGFRLEAIFREDARSGANPVDVMGFAILAREYFPRQTGERGER